MNVQDHIEDFCTQLRRRQIEGSLLCAKKTVDVLRLLVNHRRHVDAAALIDDVRTVGSKLQEAKPVELAVGNMVRRVLHLIREEAAHEEGEDVVTSVQVDALEAAKVDKPGLLSKALRSVPSGRLCPRALSLSNLLDVSIGEIDQMVGGAPKGRFDDTAAQAEVEDALSLSGKNRRGIKIPQWAHKQAVIDSIKELVDELDNIHNAITLQGVEHIHANEVILTFGMSETTYKFLREVARKREFQVVVAEGAPRFDGHVLARKLADAGIQTTLIADAAVFAMMARANKVLVGAHAVLANGGVLAPVGVHTVALAAKKHSIPFVVLVGLHKLSPLFPYDHDLTYNEFKSPGDVIDYSMVAEAFAQQEARNMEALLVESLASTSSMALQQQSAGDAASSGAPGGPGATFATTPFLGSVGAAPVVRPAGPGGTAAFWSSGQQSVLRGSPPSSGPARVAPLGGMGPLGPSASGDLGQWTADAPGGTLCVPTPMLDYIPPHLVSLFVTDTGGYVPSYVYRLLTEYYSREDYSLVPDSGVVPRKRRSVSGIAPGGV